MKRKLLKKGTILKRVYDHAPWWADDYHVKMGDLFEYVGNDRVITVDDDLVKVKPLNRPIATGYWNLTVRHFIHRDGEIAVHKACLWN